MQNNSQIQGEQRKEQETVSALNMQGAKSQPGSQSLAEFTKEFAQCQSNLNKLLKIQ